MMHKIFSFQYEKKCDIPLQDFGDATSIHFMNILLDMDLLILHSAAVL